VDRNSDKIMQKNCHSSHSESFKVMYFRVIGKATRLNNTI